MFSWIVSFKVTRAIRFSTMDAKATKIIAVVCFCLVISHGYSEPINWSESGQNGLPQGYIGDNENSIHQIVVDTTTQRPGSQTPTTPRAGAQTPTPPRPGAQTATTPRPGAQTTPRPGSQTPTTSRPGAQSTTTTPVKKEISTPTTTLDNIRTQTNISAATTPKPQPPTTKPTTKPTAKPPTKPPLPGTTTKPLQCTVDCIMSYKTGLYPNHADPCSYISCTKTDVLYCAPMKCDKGFAFSEQSSRCMQSSLPCAGKVQPK